MPRLSTVPSSSSRAAAWSCFLPGGLFQARGAPHELGPGSAAGAGSTSRSPRFAPSGQGLPAADRVRRAQPRPQLRPPRLQRSGGAEAAGPGRAPSAAAGVGGGGAAADRGASSPRACAARPRLHKKALERASPRPGARGRGRGAGGGAPGRSQEPRRGERSAARWVRGAGEGGPAARSARRPRPRLPPRNAGFPERPALGAERPLQPPAAAGRRWPEPARDPRSAIPASLLRPAGWGHRAGAGGGARWRALGSGLRAGPAAAACPQRRARSAAAVTVCLCHVCAAGGDREPGRVPSGGGAGARLGARPQPRDLAADQWTAPLPRDPEPALT